MALKLDRKTLIQLARQTAETEKRLSLDGPQTDEELHAWINLNLGIDIPRVKVCTDHEAPFTFLADLYFERSGSSIAMANRGGSKTFMVAILHLLNCKYKPGIESATVGAIQAQADRAYAHFLKLVEKGDATEDVKSSMISKTIFRNGSKLEILPGTKNAVNGPHPQVVHVDEVELMDPEVYQESRNMSQGTKIDGKTVRAMDIITSTRKRGVGPMQELLDSVHEAKLAGMEAPYTVYAWCIFETAENMPNCQVANPDLPDEEKCDCDRVGGGKWDDGATRTLKDICGGKFSRSKGWIDHETVKNVFTKSSRGIWEAQQECSRPSVEGLVFPQFSVERHGVRGFKADPQNGPIYMSIDFGGTNPHAVNWYQLLQYEIEIKNFHGKDLRLREGTIVCFDEIYKANVGNLEICQMIVRREEMWRKVYPNFRITKRFADPQGKAARLDMARYSPPLPTSWYVTREVEEHLKVCSVHLEHDLFMVDVGRCEMFVAEIESWPMQKKKPGQIYEPEKPVDDFNHCMSNFRYALANIDKLLKVGLRGRTSLPGSTGKTHTTAGERPSSVPAAGTNSNLPRSERWRSNFGPITG